MGEVINSKVNIDIINGCITVPLVLRDYIEDFGGTENDNIDLIFSYLEHDEELDYETVIKGVKNGIYFFRYE
jgi:hypothetical protein